MIGFKLIEIFLKQFIYRKAFESVLRTEFKLNSILNYNQSEDKAKPDASFYNF